MTGRTFHALPYRRGDLITSTSDDVVKLQVAWHHMANRFADGDAEVYALSGLERSLDVEPADLPFMDDDLAPAHHLTELSELALDHVGGDAHRHDMMLLNRQTAALWLAAHVTLQPGDTVVGVSPSYSHPAVTRAVADAGAGFHDTAGLAAFERAMGEHASVAAVMLTRLSVSYEILSQRELDKVVRVAKEAGALVIVDDAGGARVGPAVFDQAKSLDFGADIASTGLDKYGTRGPRLGLLAGRRDIVARVRVRAFEMGMEARPMLYPAVVRSLRQYRPARVRELVRCTKDVADALKRKLGSERITETEIVAKLEGEDVLGLAMERAGLHDAPIVPYEATAALAMLLLRDHGIFTVHFAGLPPGTSALLIKFIPPETLRRFGGAERMAAAVDASVDRLAEMLSAPAEIKSLLLDLPAPHVND